MKYVFFYLLAFFTIMEYAPAHSQNAESKKSASQLISKTKLSKDQAVKIAQSAAEKNGLDLQDFHAPEAHYEATKKDHSWTIFFSPKSMAVDGGFMIIVDDHNGKHQIVIGH